MVVVFASIGHGDQGLGAGEVLEASRGAEQGQGGAGGDAEVRQGSPEVEQGVGRAGSLHHRGRVLPGGQHR